MKRILTILISMLILASCSNQNNSVENESKDFSLEDQMNEAIIGYFGHRVEIPEQAVKTIEFNEKNGNLKVVVTTLAFMDETVEEFKADLLDSCILLLQEIQMQDKVQNLTLVVEIPYEKENGENINYGVFKIDFTQEKLLKVNFDKLNPQNLREKADFYFEAPFY
ncbi:hypothetical protein MKY09_00840 [Psychrobacillus sp. FSL K6-4046]|uniref:hypothetical protein n=1 Tax=Psychrobacillus sp. FSL K6-4046 TaxID=2921550 RepID=UPI00315A4362